MTTLDGTFCMLSSELSSCTDSKKVLEEVNDRRKFRSIEINHAIMQRYQNITWNLCANNVNNKASPRDHHTPPPDLTTGRKVWEDFTASRKVCKRNRTRRLALHTIELLIEFSAQEYLDYLALSNYKLIFVDNNIL